MPKSVGCGDGVPLPRTFFCFVMSKSNVLVYSDALKLKYVMIVGVTFPLTSPQTKILEGMCPGIAGGVDANVDGYFPGPDWRRLAADLASLGCTRSAPTL